MQFLRSIRDAFANLASAANDLAATLRQVNSETRDRLGLDEPALIEHQPEKKARGR